MSISVLLVDDHPVVRAGLVAIVQQRGFQVVGEADNGEQAIALTQQCSPDVVLCDLRLGDGIDGVEVTRRIRAQSNAPAVLILTTFDHDAQIIRALEAGAAGYLLKEVSSDTIARAITDAAAGRMVFTPGVSERVVSALRAPRVSLTEREMDVLRLLDSGRSNREIAATLVISEATVKTHVVHVLDKLAAPSRSAAVSEARRMGLLHGA